MFEARRRIPHLEGLLVLRDDFGLSAVGDCERVSDNWSL